MFLAPEVSTINALVEDGPSDRVHIFSGIRGNRHGSRRRGFDRVKAMGARAGIMAEPGEFRPPRGLFRLAVHYAAHQQVQSHIDFALAIGCNGPRWFRWCGYSASKIFPFAYLIDANQAETVEIVGRAPGCVNLIFIGRMDFKKAADIMFAALARLVEYEWTLSMVGNGPVKGDLISMANKLNISKRINWHGVVPNAMIQGLLCSHDILILPSRWDGWGAVVNEALMQGAAVICSDHCGASVLLEDPWRGAVFRAGDPDDLAHVLQAWVAHGSLSSQERARISAWSQCVQGEAGADYFLSIMGHVYAGGPRPNPPWMADQ
ncbi:glycosyltransferase [Geothrix sp. SG200]|uniref:glycosyltransferase family 4 protein n=1 Tax=Geothrix sp. SG200 TaxID=2922865 RepID=UPI001FAD9285|nr:glycosyltransferase [Geothrix sp. SG200]